MANNFIFIIHHRGTLRENNRTAKVAIKLLLLISAVCRVEKLYISKVKYRKNIKRASRAYGYTYSLE